MMRSGFGPRWRSFGRDSRAMAAVEFAMILPVMLLLYIGTVDVTRAVISTRKANLVSRTLSDLVSQQSTSTATPSTTISTIFTASTSIMQPFPTTPLTMTVSGVTIQTKSNGSCCDAIVKWSFTQNGTLRTCGSTLTQTGAGVGPSVTTIPSAIVYPNQGVNGATTTSVTSVIIADVRYTYQPFFSQALQWITGPVQKTTYMVPRAANGAVTLASPITTTSGQSGCTS